MTNSSESWTPRCSIEEADRILTGPGSLLEIETRIIDGRVLKVWKNLWPSLRLLFLNSTKEHADKTYIVYEKERYTFQEVLEKTVKCAAIFRDVYGLRKGDRVAICSHNCPNYLVVFWACHLLGVVTAFVNPSQPLKLIRHCIMLAKFALIILDTEQADRVELIGAELMLASGVSGYLVLEDHEGQGHWEGMDVWSAVFSGYNEDPGAILNDDPQILPEDDATITFTSGTTGPPKAILSSQRSFMSPVFDATSFIGRDYLRRGESLLSTIMAPQEATLITRTLCVPSSFITTMFSTSHGVKLVLMRAWNAHEAVALCTTEAVTMLGSVPSIVREIADNTTSEYSINSIKRILYGGTPIAASQLQRFKQAFPLASFVQVYALTETNASAVGFGGLDYDVRPDSCGFVSPVNEIMVMKDGGKVVPGTLGEVWLRGPNVMKGYYGDKAATDQVLTKDGWLVTGDLGRVDERGYVYISDRIKDIIIRDSVNIDSIFVENSLYTEPGVLETAAVGVPDEHSGELPVAFVTLRPGYDGLIDEEKLIATAKKLLPPYAVPVMIIVYDHGFDHTTSGKIIKVPLRAIAQKEWVRRTKKDSE
ncbi:acetyl-CoA synthetase-like protein [Guyanagaster necrorhizus]|uniref:Acetyl-CoA synthetase-like protein n=1 Tax=Guyanagaster necrorhizus TaxID=856835 RepID=A0A9P7VH05_9AGAR|nr:acetyl-CoA synthetase-like protein [Guyanagaster necrorhizus MCA 3950]KAG7440408.1 acetyl-CoA synthetase-like protein [Guyanagaster necrorhizus MCA 3950]